MSIHGVLICGFVLIGWISFQPVIGDFSEEDGKKITAGLELAQGVADLMAAKQFTETLAALGTSASPYLAAIGPFFSLVFALIPKGPSIEELYLKEVLKRLNKMMSRIDDHFYNLDRQFKDIRQKIDWNTVRLQFGHIERNILAMTRQYEYLYKVPSAALENRKTIFLRNYESNYENSGTKLFHAIVYKQGVFHEDIGSSVIRYTDSDCRQTQHFLLGVMQLLLQAVKVELTYLYVQNFTYNAEFEKKQWEERIKLVIENFKATDRKCKNNLL